MECGSDWLEADAVAFAVSDDRYTAGVAEFGALELLRIQLLRIQDEGGDDAGGA